MSHKLAKASLSVSIILFIGYFISFFKEAIIANYFGVSADVDAYTIAITIPVTLFALVSTSIQSIVIPLYSDLYYNKGLKDASSYIDNLISCVAVIAMAFILLCEILASPLISLFAPGFSPETHATATQLLRITLPTILFSVLDRVFIGMLNVHRKYTWTALSVYILNFSLILTIVLLHEKLGIVSACIGQVLGSVVQVIYVVLLSVKVYHYKPSFKFKDLYMVRTYKQSIPIIWSISVAEINAIVNRMVASFLFVGSIAALGYASKINTMMMTFFTHAIATVIYPLYAESAAKKDMAQLNARVNFTLSFYCLFLLPLMIGIFCFRSELVEVAYARGAFDKDAIEITSVLLGCYSLGILFSSFRETITKVFYSLQDTATPAKNATIGVVLNIILNLTLPLFLGVKGLAIGTSVAAVVISTRLLYQLTKKDEKLRIGFFFGNLKKIIVATVVMGVVVFVLNKLTIELVAIYRLLIGAAVGVSVYGLMILVLKIPVAKQAQEMLIKKKK